MIVRPQEFQQQVGRMSPRREDFSHQEIDGVIRQVADGLVSVCEAVKENAYGNKYK